MAGKAGSASKVRLNSFDDLFGGAENMAGEQVINANLSDLHTFKGQPFRVLDDEKMEETTESISKYGVLVPGIARPRAGGEYEIIAGHRRKRGSERAGLDKPDIIYVKNFASVPKKESPEKPVEADVSAEVKNLYFKKEKNLTSGSKGI